MGSAGKGAPATKLENLKLIPRTHMVKGKNES